MVADGDKVCIRNLSKVLHSQNNSNFLVVGEAIGERNIESHLLEHIERDLEGELAERFVM